MRNILDSEEEKHLRKLKKEEEDVLRDLAESEKELAQEAQSVRALISDVQHRLQGSARTMLQGVKDTIERCKLLIVKKPRSSPKKQRVVFQAPDLREFLQSHQAFVKPSPSNNPWAPFVVDNPRPNSKKKGKHQALRPNNSWKYSQEEDYSD
ncbi:tripartite motif-containing protein 5-like [Octodon degus]|uniref:Tripartite motif-containing protein 5-like n=1 Tax=Octodon degus TaxID=10160 RepID=A0A6P6DCV4_OCTDE|nr:tripartite motif-containing protein 5-like [Octodon degus]